MMDKYTDGKDVNLLDSYTSEIDTLGISEQELLIALQEEMQATDYYPKPTNLTTLTEAWTNLPDAAISHYEELLSTAQKSSTSELTQSEAVTDGTFKLQTRVEQPCYSRSNLQTISWFLDGEVTQAHLADLTEMTYLSNTLPQDLQNVTINHTFFDEHTCCISTLPYTEQCAMYNLQQRSPLLCSGMQSPTTTGSLSRSSSPLYSPMADSFFVNCMANKTNTGKRRRKNKRRKGKLWEFLRDLLLDEATNPTVIRWVDEKNGIFKIVHSDRVAYLWGARKSNPTMTYDKLSRALRYYYDQNILEKIDGQRLIYKFGDLSEA